MRGSQAFWPNGYYDPFWAFGPDFILVSIFAVSDGHVGGTELRMSGECVVRGRPRTLFRA
jgi:hypothetical protein